MRNVNITIASAMLGLGLLATSATAGVPSLAQNDAAKVDAPFDYVHWYWHRHHHHHHHHFITRLVAAGTVTYPVYRVEHYKIDYRSPTFAYAAPVVAGPVIPIIGWFF